MSDSTSTAPLSSALVIGGGPAGLTAAISLRQAGVAKVVVAEIKDNESAIGSELSLSAPILRVLAHIGLAESVAARGVPIPAASICAPDGTVVASIPFPPLAGPDLPGTVGITRPALHDVLWAASREAGVEARMSTSVTDISEGPDGVTVTLTDGTADTYDLVVGADGVKSHVRQMCFPGAPEPTYAGQIAWRVRVPRNTDPLLAISDLPDRRAGLITVSEEYSYLFLLVNTTEPEQFDRSENPGRLREALAAFGGPWAEVRDDITDPERVHYTPLTPIIVPLPWNRGRVVIIGDAAHATTPHLAYGAGLAMEDGVLLGQELRSATSVAEGLAAFGERRFERCRMVVENGLQICRWLIAPGTDGADPVGLTMSSQMAIGQPA